MNPQLCLKVFFSHLLIYSLINSLIHSFQDDVHLVDDFKSVLISNLDSLKNNNQSYDYDVILLGNSFTYSFIKTYSLTHLLRRYWSSTSRW